MLDYGHQSAGLVVPEVVNDPSLNLGSDDFTMIDGRRIQPAQYGKTFFLKTNDDPNFPKQTAMDWGDINPTPDFSFTGDVNDTESWSRVCRRIPGSDRVYVLRKVGDNLQLRVNGNIVRPRACFADARARRRTERQRPLTLGSRVITSTRDG